MPFLFSYGTLQDEDVQRSTVGRPLEGMRDELVGYEPAVVRIEDPHIAATLGRTHHANVTPTGNNQQRVPGTVFEVTDAELARFDEFEAAFHYVRIAAPLASGSTAWVYVHSSNSTLP